MEQTIPKRIPVNSKSIYMPTELRSSIPAEDYDAICNNLEGVSISEFIRCAVQSEADAIAMGQRQQNLPQEKTKAVHTRATPYFEKKLKEVKNFYYAGNSEAIRIAVHNYLKEFCDEK